MSPSITVNLLLLTIVVFLFTPAWSSNCPGCYGQVCKTDACDVTFCPSVPFAKCRSCCNGCIARFYTGILNWDVTELCEYCPQICTAQACKADACDVTSCPRYPSAKCISCCNGCMAKFFVGSYEVTKNCHRAYEWDFAY
uniref:uncharacterized protein LOC120329932 isoform X1 n=1 Tax=Styela clava TaxID=7725 RepID=UPI00193951E4|nr:uncharacterized protein LOC120329932 isoform X1 [Styela clava]